MEGKSFEQWIVQDATTSAALVEFERRTGISLSEQFVERSRQFVEWIRSEEERNATLRVKTGNISRESFPDFSLECRPLDDGVFYKRDTDATGVSRVDVSADTTLDIQLALLRYRYVMVQFQVVGEAQAAVKAAEQNSKIHKVKPGFGEKRLETNYQFFSEIKAEWNALSDEDKGSSSTRELNPLRAVFGLNRDQVLEGHLREPHPEEELQASKDGLHKSYGVGGKGRRLTEVARHELVRMLQLCRKGEFREPIEAEKLWEMDSIQQQKVPDFSKVQSPLDEEALLEVYKVALNPKLWDPSLLRADNGFPVLDSWAGYSHWMETMQFLHVSYERNSKAWLSMEDITFLLIALGIEEPDEPRRLRDRLEKAEERYWKGVVGPVKG